jgi:hypothetical protein
MATDRSIQKIKSIPNKNIRLVKKGLVRAEHLHDYVLRLEYSDGFQTEINFLPYLVKSKNYFKFIEMGNFLKFKLEDYGHGIYWPGNVFDFPSSAFRND